MKKVIVLSILALLVSPAAAFAAKADGPKARAIAQFDTDKDGKFNAGEIAAIHKAFAKEPKGDLKRFDADSDGKLSEAEIAQMIPGSGKKSGGGKKDGAASSKDGGKKSGGKKDAGSTVDSSQ